MKKLVLIFCLILFAALASGQALKKGNLVGFHQWKPELAQGVTMDQYIKFVKDKLIPAYKKNMPGIESYVFTAVRGECTDCVGFMIVFMSEKERNKYWNADGTNTDLLNKAIEKMQPVIDESKKMDLAADRYTDWVVK